MTHDPKNPKDPNSSPELDAWISGRLELAARDVPGPSANFKRNILARAAQQSTAATPRKSFWSDFMDWLPWILLPAAAGAAWVGYRIVTGHSPFTAVGSHESSSGQGGAGQGAAVGPSASSSISPATAGTPKPGAAAPGALDKTLDSESKLKPPGSAGDGARSAFGNRAGAKGVKADSGFDRSRDGSDGRKGMEPGSSPSPTPSASVIPLSLRLRWQPAAPGQIELSLESVSGAVSPPFAVERQMVSVPGAGFRPLSSLSSAREHALDAMTDPSGQNYRACARTPDGQWGCSAVLSITASAGVPEAPIEPCVVAFSNESGTTNLKSPNPPTLAVVWGIPSAAAGSISGFTVKVTSPGGASQSFSIPSTSDRIVIDAPDLTQPKKIEISESTLSGTVSAPPLYYCPAKLTPGDTVTDGDVSAIRDANLGAKLLPPLSIADPKATLCRAAMANRADVNADRQIGEADVSIAESLRGLKCPF